MRLVSLTPNSSCEMGIVVVEGSGPGVNSGPALLSGTATSATVLPIEKICA